MSPRKDTLRHVLRWITGALLLVTVASHARAQEPGNAPAAPLPAIIGVTAVPSSRPVELIPTARFPAVAAHSNRKSAYNFTVASTGWFDTGVDVLVGDSISVESTGAVTLADGRSVTADGAARGWRDLLRQFPLNSAQTGSLIGRVTDLGASVPFALGTAGTARMPTSGRLFLAVNAPPELLGSGAYKVKLRFAKPPEPNAISPVPNSASSPAAPIADISTVLSPQTFAPIPRRVADATGDPGDMVNFALIGTQSQIEAAFQSAGWVPVDKSVEDAVLHGILATLSHQAYTEVPMSTLFLFGRPQDLSFARGDPIQVAAKRHHLRLWRTTQTIGSAPLWVGSATHDIGFERDARGKTAGDVGGYTHRIDPDIDLERQFLLQSFDAAGAFRSAAYVTPLDPLRDARTATGGSFHSDGRVLVMALQ